MATDDNSCISFLYGYKWLISFGGLFVPGLEALIVSGLHLHLLKSVAESANHWKLVKCLMLYGGANCTVTRGLFREISQLVKLINIAVA